MPAKVEIKTPEEIDQAAFATAMKPLTLKQRNFCQAIINGMTPYQAFKAAGYKHGNRNVDLVNSKKLYDTPRIQKALGAIHMIVNKDHKVTRDEAVKMFMEHREKALERNQIGAANQAVMGIAKVLGLDIHTQKTEVKHTYEVEQATQELYKMLRSRGKAISKQPEPDPHADVEDAEVIEGKADEADT